MITIYEDSDYLDALKQYRKIKLLYVAVALLYVLLLAACMIWNVSLPYDSPTATPIKIITSLITIAFILFSFPYCDIKIRRVKAYCRLLRNLSEGIKEKGKAFFSHIDDWETKDRVDVNVLVFKTWNSKKVQWDYLNVYVDAEKELPEFKENEEVEYITEGNVLISYRKTGNFCKNKINIGEEK